MPVLSVLTYPDKRLRQIAQPVDKVSDPVRLLIDSMFATMYAQGGIGLAATQVGVAQRVLVIDLDGSKQQQYCLVNPKIIQKNGTVVSSEGCLSVPDLFIQVERASEIDVEALDRFGQIQRFSATGLLSNCIQHEIDHLDGRLLIDSVSSLKRMMYLKKIQKKHRSVR